MSRLLGRGKKSKGAKNAAPTPGEAINKLRGVEEMLAKKQEYLEAKITEQENIARKNAKTNKRAALQAGYSFSYSHFMSNFKRLFLVENREHIGEQNLLETKVS